MRSILKKMDKYKRWVAIIMVIIMIATLLAPVLSAIG